MCNCMYQSSWYVFLCYVFLSVNHSSSQSCSKRLLYFSCFNSHLDCIKREGCRRRKTTIHTTFSIFNMLLPFHKYALNSDHQCFIAGLNLWEVSGFFFCWSDYVVVLDFICKSLFALRLAYFPNVQQGQTLAVTLKVDFSTCYCYMGNAILKFLFIYCIYLLHWLCSSLIVLFFCVDRLRNKSNQNPN